MDEADADVLDVDVEPVGYPRVRPTPGENGSGWITQLLHLLDYTNAQMPQAFAERPSATFQRNIWVHLLLAP